MSDPHSTAPSAVNSSPGTKSTDGRTDWARLRGMEDAEAEANAAADPDNPPATDAWLAAARVIAGPEQRPVALRLDADVFASFRAQGDGYQTRINEVLRAFYEHHRDAA